jgi:hemoglobin-like flavoprotein
MARRAFRQRGGSGMLRDQDTSRGTTMRDDAAIITETLERVGARVGDPTPLIFARLFAEIPEAEALFVRDNGGLVRGQMFQVTMESLLDFLGDRAYGANLIQIERVNHQGLGVEPEMFDRFYLTVMATFKDVLGAGWTAEMEAVWTRVIHELTGLAG